MKIEEHYPLQEIHTFHLPVKTRYYVEYDNIDELCSFLSESPLLEQYPCYHMGGGSNLLFLHDYPGVILHSAIRFIEQVSENGDSLVLRAGAGVVWDDFVKYCVENNWGGVENLSLIPGEVGASAVQNIGAYGVEVKDVIERVETIDIHTRQPHIFTNEECKYGYRDSIFKNEYRGQYIVTAVQYRLQKNATFHLDYGNLREAVARCSNPTLADVRRVVIEIRRSKLPDPDETGNAGSFFKNPVVPKAHYERLKKRYPDMPHYPVDEARVKLPAGWLIDRAGWRGKTHGGAGVYEKQSLVLVNRGDATTRDITELADKICRSVKEIYDIDLSPEVNYIQ